MSFLRALSETDIQNVELVLGHYCHRIRLNSNAMNYFINKRHIQDRAIEEFEIGFGDRSLRGVVTDEIRGSCQRFGLIATDGASNGREVFRGCLTFPVRDEYGFLVNVYGRKICDTLRKSSEVYVTANTNNQCVFNSQVLAKFNRIVLCSSPIEAITLWSMGIENVVSLLGMQSLSDEQVLQFQFNDIDHVDLLFACSPKAARCLCITMKKLQASDIASSKFSLPKGQDINDCYTNRCDFLFAMKNLVKHSEQKLKWRG